MILEIIHARMHRPIKVRAIIDKNLHPSPVTYVVLTPDARMQTKGEAQSDSMTPTHCDMLFLFMPLII